MPSRRVATSERLHADHHCPRAKCFSHMSGAPRIATSSWPWPGDTSAGCVCGLRVEGVAPAVGAGAIAVQLVDEYLEEQRAGDLTA
jgi:flavin-dependent dehydrogenase